MVVAVGGDEYLLGNFLSWKEQNIYAIVEAANRQRREKERKEVKVWDSSDKKNKKEQKYGEPKPGAKWMMRRKRKRRSPSGREGRSQIEVLGSRSCHLSWAVPRQGKVSVSPYGTYCLEVVVRTSRERRKIH